MMNLLKILFHFKKQNTLLELNKTNSLRECAGNKTLALDLAWILLPAEDAKPEASLLERVSEQREMARELYHPAEMFSPT